MKAAESREGKRSLSCEDEESAAKRNKKQYPKITGKTDAFCWTCHRPGNGTVGIATCSNCPRAYHLKCGHLDKVPEPNEKWVCPECDTVERADRQAPSSAAYKNTFAKLLGFVLERVKRVDGVENFSTPVDTNKWHDYLDYVIQPMDLPKLKSNIDAHKYRTVESFLADFRWLVHASYVYNSVHSVYTKIAKSIMNVAKQECEEVKNCSECYMHACTLGDTWFMEACSTPHILVWAQLSGFPYWPAKVMRQLSGDIVDVRFFGDHTRANVPASSCFLYSRVMPCSVKSKKHNSKITCGIEEAEIYVKNLKATYNVFCYAQYRVSYLPKEEDLMRKLQLPDYPADNDAPEFLARVESMRKEKMIKDEEFHTEMKKIISEQEKSKKPVTPMKRKSVDSGSKLMEMKRKLVKIDTPQGQKIAIMNMSGSESDTSPKRTRHQMKSLTSSVAETTGLPESNGVHNAITSPTKVDDEAIKQVLARSPPDLSAICNNISPHSLSAHGDSGIIESLSRKLLSPPKKGLVNGNKFGLVRRLSQLTNVALESDSDSDALVIAEEPESTADKPKRYRNNKRQSEMTQLPELKKRPQGPRISVRKPYVVADSSEVTIPATVAPSKSPPIPEMKTAIVHRALPATVTETKDSKASPLVTVRTRRSLKSLNAPGPTVINISTADAQRTLSQPDSKTANKETNELPSGSETALLNASSEERKAEEEIKPKASPEKPRRLSNSSRRTGNPFRIDGGFIVSNTKISPIPSRTRRSLKMLTIGSNVTSHDAQLKDAATPKNLLVDKVSINSDSKDCTKTEPAEKGHHEKEHQTEMVSAKPTTAADESSNTNVDCSKLEESSVSDCEPQTLAMSSGSPGGAKSSVTEETPQAMSEAKRPTSPTSKESLNRRSLVSESTVGAKDADDTSDTLSGNISQGQAKHSDDSNNEPLENPCQAIIIKTQCHISSTEHGTINSVKEGGAPLRLVTNASQPCTDDNDNVENEPIEPRLTAPSNPPKAKCGLTKDIEISSVINSTVITIQSPKILSSNDLPNDREVSSNPPDTMDQGKPVSKPLACRNTEDEILSSKADRNVEQNPLASSNHVISLPESPERKTIEAVRRLCASMEVPVIKVSRNQCPMNEKELPKKASTVTETFNLECTPGDNTVQPTDEVSLGSEDVCREDKIQEAEFKDAEEAAQSAQLEKSDFSTDNKTKPIPSLDMLDGDLSHLYEDLEPTEEDDDSDEPAVCIALSDASQSNDQGVADADDVDDAQKDHEPDDSLSGLSTSENDPEALKCEREPLRPSAEAPCPEAPCTSGSTVVASSTVAESHPEMNTVTDPVPSSDTDDQQEATSASDEVQQHPPNSPSEVTSELAKNLPEETSAKKSTAFSCSAKCNTPKKSIESSPSHSSVENSQCTCIMCHVAHPGASFDKQVEEYHIMKSFELVEPKRGLTKETEDFLKRLREPSATPEDDTSDDLVSSVRQRKSLVSEPRFIPIQPHPQNRSFDPLEAGPSSSKPSRPLPALVTLTKDVVQRRLSSEQRSLEKNSLGGLQITSSMSLNPTALKQLSNACPTKQTDAEPKKPLIGTDKTPAEVRNDPKKTTQNATTMPLPIVIKPDPDAEEVREVPSVPSTAPSKPTIKLKQMSSLLERPPNPSPPVNPEASPRKECTTPKFNMVPPFEPKKTLADVRKLIESKSQFISAKLKKDIYTLFDQIQHDYDSHMELLENIADGSLNSVESTLESNKNLVFEEMKTRLRKQVDAHIADVKKKQWCVLCGNEAAFHCCWGYNYCCEDCQKTDWVEHTKVCTQYNMTATDPHIRASPRFKALLDKQIQSNSSQKILIQDLIDSPVAVSLNSNPPAKGKSAYGRGRKILAGPRKTLMESDVPSLLSSPSLSDYPPAVTPSSPPLVQRISDQVTSYRILQPGRTVRILNAVKPRLPQVAPRPQVAVKAVPRAVASRANPMTSSGIQRKPILPAGRIAPNPQTKNASSFLRVVGEHEIASILQRNLLNEYN